MITRKLFRRYCILIPLLLLLLTSCFEKKEQVKVIPGVIVTPAIEEMILKGGDIIGQIVTKDKVTLEARVEGFLVKKCVADGQLVKRGDLLYQIENNQYKANLQSAQANLENKKAILKTAMIEFKRLEYLSGKGATSQDDLDIAIRNRDMANANLLDAKAKLEIATLNLSYTDIKAPFDGQIGNSLFSVGDLIGPGSFNASQPINTLVCLDPIRVEFNFAESTLVGIMENHYFSFSSPENKEQPQVLEHVVVSLELSNGSKYKHKGIINFIDNHVDSSTGTVKIRAVFSNPKHILRPGGYVTAFVSSDKKEKTLLIPQSSVLQEQVGTYVLTVNKDNIVKVRFVKLGNVYNEYIEVLKGLNIGEVVIKEGLQKVREGMKVNPKVDKTRFSFGNAKNKKLHMNHPGN